MILSSNLQTYLAADSKEEYTAELMQSILTDLRKRYPEFPSNKSTDAYFTKLARPVFNERVLQLNAEIGALQIKREKKEN